MKPAFWRKAMGIALILGLAGGAYAQLAQWNGFDYHTGSYDFSDDDHWIPFAPSATDAALFTGNGFDGIPDAAAFTVQLSEDSTVESFTFEEGRFGVTFDLNGYDLTASDRSVIAGAAPDDPIHVAVTGEGTVVFAGLDIATVAGTLGSLHVYGAQTVHGTAGQTLMIGNRGGVGTYRITNGARLTTGRQIIAGDREGFGSIEVGSGAEITTSNHFWLGDRGSASLLIESGGSVTMTGSNNVVFGLRAAAGNTSTGLITGEGSLLRSDASNVHRGITIGGGPRDDTLSTQGTAHVTVADRGRMESTQIIMLWEQGKLTVDNGTVTAGTDLEALGGAEFEFILYNANRDALIQVGADVNLEPDVTLELKLGDGAAFSVGEFVELIRYDGLNGSFKDIIEGYEFELEVPGNGTTYDFRFTYAGGAESKTIGLEVIPEPHTALLLTLGAAVLWVRRRRS